jgi:hypothetical protein
MIKWKKCTLGAKHRPITNKSNMFCFLLIFTQYAHPSATFYPQDLLLVNVYSSWILMKKNLKWDQWSRGKGVINAGWQLMLTAHNAWWAKRCLGNHFKLSTGIVTNWSNLTKTYCCCPWMVHCMHDWDSFCFINCKLAWIRTVHL